MTALENCCTISTNPNLELTPGKVYAQLQSIAGWVLHPLWTMLSCGQQDSPSGDVVHTGIFMLSLSLSFCLLNRSVQIRAGREGVKSSFKQGSALGNPQPG